ncbi:MAG: bifunctional folylpolyglutamate synthase/dihydrofolate synthase [Candidatus Kapabacteria bacterium]|nr:bifunctional folylpolyglutamate synthase/dihydrofolate synthase [Candidatus Kapabacteria bacterium]
MSIQPLLDKLFAMTFHGIKPGLDRITSLLDGIDHPQRRYPVIHVAGTNGKGSTCAMLASILQHAGYRVGLYTSPHIRRFNERIRVQGAMIDDADIARLAVPLMDAAAPVGGTFFEVTTAMALQYFAEKRVDVAVIETGLGGRLDATNVVEPILSVITSIDYDHMEYLGNTLEKIASEKAGIIKESTPVVIGDTRRELRQVFERAAAQCHAPITFAHDVLRVEIDTMRQDLTMSVSVIADELLRYYDVDLCGQHQAQNIAAVLAALPSLREVYFIDEQHVRDGLRTVRQTTGLDGRIQLVWHDPTIVMDVSHNPAGIATLVSTLAACGFPPASWQVVFGAMADKDVQGMLQALAPFTASLHVCTPDLPRAMPVSELVNLAHQCNIAPVVPHISVAEACGMAGAMGPTLICGSFHVADEALAWLQDQGDRK